MCSLRSEILQQISSFKNTKELLKFWPEITKEVVDVCKLTQSSVNQKGRGNSKINSDAKNNIKNLNKIIKKI